MGEAIVQKIPWQVIVVLVLIMILLLFVLLIVLVFKNKNLESKINYKDRQIGISIKDSNNKKKEPEKIDKNVNYSNKILWSLIKTHPLYTTTFNHFIYSDSENTVNMTKKIISQYNDGNINDIVDFKLSYISAIYKIYIFCIKNELDPILMELNDVIKTNKIDDLYMKIDNFISYVDSLNIIKNALDINKIMVHIQKYNIESLTFKDSIKTLNENFNSHIRNACYDLKRDLIIHRSNLDNVYGDDSDINMSVILVTIIRIFDSVLDHIYGIISKYRIMQINSVFLLNGELYEN